MLNGFEAQTTKACVLYPMHACCTQCHMLPTRNYDEWAMQNWSRRRAGWLRKAGQGTIRLKLVTPDQKRK